MRGRGKTLTVFALLAAIAAMVTLAAFSPPLYRLFARTTGYGGTVRLAKAPPPPERILARTVSVRFNADVNPALPWRVAPEQGEITLRLGETATAFLVAQSLAEAPVTGAVTFNVTPAKAGIYFNKLDCFCFTTQRLAPDEVARLPVQFFIDPDLADDRNLDDVTTITLSYSFFKAARQRDQRSGPAARTTANRSPAPGRAVN